MKPCLVIIISLLMMGCHHDGTLRLGTYKSIEYNKIAHGLLLLKGYKTAYVGSEIMLKADSSCSYTTCGNSIAGRWFHKDDSVFLVITANRWRNDSLNIYGYNGKQPACPVKPVGFKINGDYIERVHVLKNGDKILEKLKFGNQ
jgi:hypothetical protein